MRTPRLFLGIFVLALLLPMLLLACGGSDEPADEPSSERATVEPTDLPISERVTDEPTEMPNSERATGEPEGNASSGQAAPEPTTPSAEPSPTPRATARPPMAQTSAKTDREALIALYNATGGPNWINNYNWLTDAPIYQWARVSMDGTRLVTSLDLS